MIVEKETLKPGVYFKNGRLVLVTRQDCEDYRNFSRDLHAKTNLKIPLCLEHPAADRGVDAEGFPLSDADLSAKAESLRRTVGLSIPQSRIDPETGAYWQSYDVKDPDVAKQVADSRIEFVSPELRPGGWVDGLGNIYDKAITHVALTHRPIQVDQTPGFIALSSDDAIPLSSLDEAICLSTCELLEDQALAKTQNKKPPAKPAAGVGSSPNGRLLKAKLQEFLNSVALADDDDEEGKPPKQQSGSSGESAGGERPGEGDSTPPATNAGTQQQNADMPKGGSVDDKQMQALLAHLREAGFVLPADTDETTLVAYLLTSVMTKNAADAEAASKSDSDQSQGAAQEQNPMGINQMSSTNDAKVSPAEARRRLISRIQACRSIPAPTRDDLLVRVGAMQFSDDGAEKVSGGMSIGDAIAMFENQAVQFADDSPQAALAKRIQAARKAGKMQPGVADQLLAKVGLVQFSDDGVEQVAAGGVSLGDVVTSIERSASLVDGVLKDATAGYQLSDADGVEHPRGDSFRTGQTIIQEGDPRAKKIAADFLARQGVKPRSAVAGAA